MNPPALEEVISQPCKKNIATNLKIQWETGSRFPGPVSFKVCDAGHEIAFLVRFKGESHGSPDGCLESSKQRLEVNAPLP